MLQRYESLLREGNFYSQKSRPCWLLRADIGTIIHSWSRGGDSVTDRYTYLALLVLVLALLRPLTPGKRADEKEEKHKNALQLEITAAPNIQRIDSRGGALVCVVLTL